MKVNLGSGRLGKDSLWSGEDWLNIDDAAFEEDKGDWSFAKYLDWNMEKTPWPIETGSVECIWASHVLEHFVHKHIQLVLQECYRIMKDGAPMRIVCPDPRKFVANWQMKNMQFILDCYGQQNWDRWGYGNGYAHIGFTDMFFGDHYSHAACVSIDYIQIVLIRIGFRKVNEMAYANTEFPQFFGSYDYTMYNRPYMSWFLEAVR